MKEINVLQTRKIISAILVNLYNDELNIIQKVGLDENYSIDKILLSSDYLEFHFVSIYQDYTIKLFPYDEFLPRILKTERE